MNNMIFTSGNLFLILSFILSLYHISFVFDLIPCAECIVVSFIFTADILDDPNIKTQSFLDLFHDTRTHVHDKM